MQNGTVDMTPSWKEAANMIEMLFQSGNPEAMKVAHEELQRMAKFADMYIQLTKEKESKNTKVQRYLVWSDNDPNDCFEVDAVNSEQAAYSALDDLGWCLSAEPYDPEDEDEDEGESEPLWDGLRSDDR